MKIKTTGIMLVWLASLGFACAGTNDISTLLQKGLFEEEANHHLDAAIECYQEAIGHFDKDRQLTAIAIFRLGECYRLQGKTNEANVQYQRIVREFSDQSQLVDLSRGYLPKASGGASLGTDHAAFTQNLTKISDGDMKQNPDEQAEIRRIKDMIQNSPDLINSPRGEEPSLVSVARRGWMSAAKLLVDNGAIVNPPSPYGSTPLSAATDAGNKGMVEYLLSVGANPNALDHIGWPALDYAVNNGFRSVTETLLAHGADVEVTNRFGDRPLRLAARANQLVLAEMLLAHNADVNAQASNGDRALHCAAFFINTAMAKVLLDHKADVNAPGKGGETALFRAIQNNHLEMVQFLISNQASVNIKSESGETPLLAAVGKKDINIAIVKALLDNGADVEATVNSHSPLHNAVNEERADVVQLLLEKNAAPNAGGLWNVLGRDGDHEYYMIRTVTPLILASSRDSDAKNKIAELLLQHSANPNLTDETGQSALDYAIRRENTNLIRELILHHADVNAPDKQGNPPLAYVWASTQSEPIKKMLIQAGANEDYQRRGAIFITQKGSGSIGDKVFIKGTNAFNRYTLFELISSAYVLRPRVRGGGYSGISFPDFAHVAINRLKTDGSKIEIAVDLKKILESEDCAKNPSLEWGDVILIPQLDHKVNDYWTGLSQTERNTLGKCLRRQVKIVVKGQTARFILEPAIELGYGPVPMPRAFPMPMPQFSPVAPGSPAVGVPTAQPRPPLASSPQSSEQADAGHIMYSFDLDEVVHQANVLLISSDLTRVKVTRHEAEAGGQPLVMEFNLETQPPPDVWLVDGDIIEIPEREPK